MLTVVVFAPPPPPTSAADGAAPLSWPRKIDPTCVPATGAVVPIALPVKTNVPLPPRTRLATLTIVVGGPVAVFALARIVAAPDPVTVPKFCVQIPLFEALLTTWRKPLTTPTGVEVETRGLAIEFPELRLTSNVPPSRTVL